MEGERDKPHSLRRTPSARGQRPLGPKTTSIISINTMKQHQTNKQMNTKQQHILT